MLTAAALGTLKRALTRRLAARAAQTASDVDNLLVDLLRRTRLSFAVVASIYAGALALDLPRTPARLLSTVAVVAALLQIAVWGNGLIAFAVSRYVRHKMEEDAATATTVGAFGFIARLVLWTLIVFLARNAAWPRSRRSTGCPPGRWRAPSWQARWSRRPRASWRSCRPGPRACSSCS